MVIKDLVKADFEAFYSCFGTLMKEGYGQFPYELSSYLLNNEYKKDNFILIIERNTRKILVIEEETSKEIIGFIIGDHGYGGVGFISWFGILPEHRNKGYGSMLLQDYEKYISMRNNHLIELFTYEKAVPFYKKHGFVEVGRRPKGYYGMKNIIMDKKLRDFDLRKLIGPVTDL